MAETTDIIEQAMADAGLDDSTPEPLDDDSNEGEDGAGGDISEDKSKDATPDKSVEPVESAGDKAVDQPDKDAAKTGDTRSKEDKALDAELLALGVKPPKEGRDNRIPYSRTRKIIANALKKRGDAHELTKKELEAKITALTERTGYMDTVDQMIARDPDAYVRELARLHPDKYSKFIPVEGAKKSEVVDLNKDDPKPVPDAKYADGTIGYSPEGLDALLAWNTRAATRVAIAEARKEMDKEYGAVKKQFEAGVSQSQRVQKVREIVEEQRAIWGADFTNDEKLGDKSEILIAYNAEKAAAKTAGRAVVPFGRIVAKVLRAKLQKDQNQIREEVIAEQNKTAAERKAASTAAPGGSKAAMAHGDTSDGLTSAERAVADAMRAAGLS